jgi:hypothetical protein
LEPVANLPQPVSAARTSGVLLLLEKLTNSNKIVLSGFADLGLQIDRAVGARNQSLMWAPDHEN